MQRPKPTLPRIIKIILSQKDKEALEFISVNELAQNVGALRAFQIQFRGNTPKVRSAMGQPTVNFDSPYVADMRMAITKAKREVPSARALPFEIATEDACRYALMVMGTRRRALVFVRERQWSEEDVENAHDLSRIYWGQEALVGAKVYRMRRSTNWIIRLGLISAIIAAGVLIEMPVRVIAPARIMPQNPTVLTAAVAGRVQTVDVTPNAQVSAGQRLVALDRQEQDDMVAQMRQRELVAAQRLAQLQKSSFLSAESRSQVVVLEAELELARIEREAQERKIARYEITAPHQGRVAIAARQDLAGVFVEAGHQLAEVFDPAKVEVAVDVAVSDAIVLTELQSALLFLNDASLASIALEAKELPLAPVLDDRGTVSYQLNMTFPSDLAPPRVGAEGVVRLNGPDMPVGYVLLRPVINKILQWLWN